MKNTINVLSVRMAGLAAIIAAITIGFTALSLTGCGGGGGDGKTLDSIAVTTDPTKTTYTIGEELNTAGMVITATYSDGTTAAVLAKDYTISGFDSATAGTKTVIVTHAGKKAQFTVTVNPAGSNVTDKTPIPTAEIVIEAPVKDEVPATAATVEADTFTASAVTWSPADNPFKGGVAYTATVTLTAKDGYNFTGTTAATVNGEAATVLDNTGAAVKVSHAFPATKLKSVTEITIKTPPTKLSYTQGDTLDLAGLVITLKYDDGSTEDIAAANFGANNITAIPSQGNDLTVALHNGKPVSVSYGAKHSINTANLTVTMNFAIDAIAAQTYNGSEIKPALVVKDGAKTLTLTTDYTVAYSGNTNAGEATVSVSGAGTYAGSTGTATFTINKATPVADDYTISGNFSAASAAAAAITVTAKTGKSDGAVSVKYAGSTTLPTTGGSYTVTFDVAETANWNAASGFSAGTLNIAFTSVSDLGTWLAAQPTNTIATAYPVRLNVSDLSSPTNIRTTLNSNANKYVNLDCSGSTFTSVPNSLFYGTTPYGCATLTGITIPNSVTSIGSEAFSSCASLTSVTIPSKVTSIGQDAFAGCTSLTAITVDAANTAYSSENGVLYNKAKTNLIKYPAKKTDSTFTIPNTVTSLGTFVFDGCTSLASVTFEATSKVTSIGTYAFRACTSLTSVTIPNSVTSIGQDAFSDCSSLASITIPDSVTSIGAYAFAGCTSLAGVTFEATSKVTSIGTNAFRNCSKLASITIPDSVTSIGTYAFDGCTSLTGITIPDSVTTIGNYAFRNCSKLASITLPFVGNTKTGTTNTHFGYIFGASSYSGQNSSIPASLKTVIITGGSVAENAFNGCSNITGITIGSGVTTIGNDAFKDCANLAAITVDAANTAYLSQSGILYNKPVTDFILIPPKIAGAITIPDGITSIAANAFQNFSNITSVTIPNSVTAIGASAFNGCAGLTSITIPFVGGNGTTAGNRVFGYIFGGANNNNSVPASIKTVIITGNGDQLGIYSSAFDSAFGGCSNITSVTIGSGVKRIGINAFQNCTGLTSVTIENGATMISQQAFYRCSSLTSITIPNSVTTIDNQAFSGCTNLSSVSIGSGVTTIGTDVFKDCANLAAITVDAANTKYLSQSGILYDKPTTAFLLIPPKIAGAITIPEDITSIAASAFYLKDITGVTIPSSVNSIGKNAFERTKITSVTIPNSVTTIAEETFSYCSSLTTVILGTGVTSIEQKAFQGCSALTSVKFQSTITASGFDANAFDFSQNNLRDKYLAIGSGIGFTGGIGTYTKPNSFDSTWTRQP